MLGRQQAARAAMDCSIALALRRYPLGAFTSTRALCDGLLRGGRGRIALVLGREGGGGRAVGRASSGFGPGLGGGVGLPFGVSGGVGPAEGGSAYMSASGRYPALISLAIQKK